MIDNNHANVLSSDSLSEEKCDAVILQLSDIIRDYLEKHPRLSLNGLSKRCRVSEPTIRRIAKMQVKTVPNVSTVLDIVTTIYKTSDVGKIVELCGGAVADFLKESLPHLNQQALEYSGAVNSQLQDPTKYLIYKLTLNGNGLTEHKLRQLFGEVGRHEMQPLLKHGIVEFDGEVFRAKVKNFQGSREDFVDHFRAVANFIKPNKVISGEKLNPLFVNGSDSVSPEAYAEILKVQKAALRKINQIVSAEDSAGDIPMFFLCALDTLDVDSAFEIALKSESN